MIVGGCSVSGDEHGCSDGGRKDFREHFAVLAMNGM